jgi:hypothetical protein
MQLAHVASSALYLEFEYWSRFDDCCTAYSCRFSKEELLQFLQGKITISSESAITNIPVPAYVEPSLRCYKSPAPPAVTVFQNWMAEHFHKLWAKSNHFIYYLPSLG